VQVVLRRLVPGQASRKGMLEKKDSELLVKQENDHRKFEGVVTILLHL
jgi:hypothetical protein